MTTSGGAHFTGQQFKTWQRICDDINIVRFPSALDAELDAMYANRSEYNPGVIFRDGKFMNYTVSDEELKTIISEHYQNMQRLLDES
ncbi:MAG: hypothetical protein J1E06_09105 [Acutalibacter sp.]|nr:hypothetical protein [Acutalibacter sp.]